MPIFGVGRERLVRVLQNLIENAGQHSVQDENARVGTTSMKATGTTPPSGGSPPVPPLADAAPPDVADVSLAHGSSPTVGAPARRSSDPELSTADAASGSDIDQVRDILFGGQMREHERRLAGLEERLAKELAEVREEIRDRCAMLERYVRDELESITIELRVSQQSRTSEERRLSESIVDAAKAAEERITALSAQLLEQNNSISDDLHRRHADLLALIERDTAELRDGKADRAALSALFMEVARRLRDESVVPADSGEARPG
jgi:hypothetical protein